MTSTLRRIAVSGSAAVALLGGAATITTAAADTASATEIHAAAPADTQPGGTAGIDNSLNGPAPQGGIGQQIQQPGYNPQQVQTQASGGAIGAGVVAILVLGIVVFVRVKHRDIKPGDAVLVGLFGIAISGTVIGAMGDQITTSLVGSLGGVLGGL